MFSVFHGKHIARSGIRCLHNLGEHVNPNSKSPLLQSYRTTWPDPSPVTNVPEPVLPKRTVPDHVLKFKLSATYEHGTAIFFPHLKFNPADFKVALYVSPSQNLAVTKFTMHLFSGICRRPRPFFWGKTNIS